MKVAPGLLTVLILLTAPSGTAASFTATGNLLVARHSHTATLLSNGKVLIAGGADVPNAQAAELYDPSTATFAATGDTKTSRSDHTATALPNGKVLLAGGGTSTAELYDPAAGTFTTTGSMSGTRSHATATLLADGSVLVVGGDEKGSELQTAEVYADGKFTLVGSMKKARSFHTATLLPNGKVLIAGGSNSTDGTLITTELYDPTAKTFSASGSMGAARRDHSATLLSNGRVLIAGGSGTSAELYDATAGTFAPTGNMNVARTHQTATLLANGTVLIVGGDAGSGFTQAADLYDLATGTFTATANMTLKRAFHTATLLGDGRVLVAGNATATNAAELFDGAIGSFTLNANHMTGERAIHTATVLTDGRVLIVGGGFAPTSNTAELYDGTFIATGNLTEPRNSHTATLLPDGRVLIAGGSVNATAELFDPATGTFVLTPPMGITRMNHTATLLPNGKVLITGGIHINVASNTAEVFAAGTPVFNSTFAATHTTMVSARQSHTATLLPNGNVLIVGGNTLTAELYDPLLDTFTATGSMAAARSNHTATLLPNGKVLIAGGGANPTAEVYTPATGTFGAPVAMSATRAYHTATLLANGKVLIAGGSMADPTSAEIYDPASNTFSTAASLAEPREEHTATALPDGTVLMAGGTYNEDLFHDTAELYDAGLNYRNARRPVIASATSPLCQPSGMTLTGSLFTSDSEGSSGSTNSSAANAPVLRLQRVDNEQFVFGTPLSFSAGSFASGTLTTLPSGVYRTAIVSNAVPSVEKLIAVTTTPLLGTYGAASVPVGSGLTVAPSSVPAGYNSSLYPIVATNNTGFTGKLRVNASDGSVSVTNAGPVGTFTIDVSATTVCGSASTSFTLDVIGPPASVLRAGGGSQSAGLNTSFPSPLKALVRDVAGHPLSNVPVQFSAPASGASATFPAGGVAQTNASGIASITPVANGILGSYNATATVDTHSDTFGLTNLQPGPAFVVATATTTTSITVSWSSSPGAVYEVRRVDAVNGAQSLGLFPADPSSPTSIVDNAVVANTAYVYRVRMITPTSTGYSAPDLATTVIFTDPTLTVRSTIIKANHFTQLRTAVNAVRVLAGFAAFPFTDALNPGSTFIRQLHLFELRSILDAARTELALPTIPYSNTGNMGTLVRAADINELRIGVQ